MADLDDLIDEIRRSGRPVDQRLAVFAEHQHGVADYRQLGRLGLGPGGIQHRAGSGRLHRLHVGVYAIGRRAVARRGLWVAAVLACGPDALLSHRSAATLWGLLHESGADVDVTIPGRSRRGSAGFLVHNVRRLHADDRCRRDRIPVTSIPRTLLDLAEVVPLRRLLRAIDEADRLRLFDLRAVDALCARSRGRRGVPALREALRRYRPTAPLTRSELERIFADVCDVARLPRPAMNLFVAGYEVDAAWLEQGLVVEVDGYEFHRTRAAFEADRQRDATLQRHGLRVVRVTDRRLKEDRPGVVDDLRALLGAA